jgi:hypothetical protein
MSRLVVACFSVSLCICGLTTVRAQDVDVAEQAASPDAVTSEQPLPVVGRGVSSESQRTDESKVINAGAHADAVGATPRRFRYAVNLNLRGVYDDNIFLTRNDKVADFYFTVEPRIILGFGDIVGTDLNSVRFDYAPSAIFYADHSSSNAVQHIIRLLGQYHFRRLSVTLSQDVQLLEGANLNSISSTDPNPVPIVRLDTGGNTDVNSYTTNGAFSYDLSGKTFLSGALQYAAYDYEGALIDSETLSGNVFFNFNYSPKLVVGVGATAGYNWVDAPSPDQSYEQINARVTYVVTGKINLNASGGVEFRQFENSDRNGSYVSPVYELGATYQPFDGTSLSLNGNRRTQNSAVAAGQDYSSTNITLGVRQRFMQRIYLALALGYENSSYFSTVTGADSSREDNYFFLQLAIDVTLTRFWTFGAYYLHRQNDSSTDFEFDNNQFGVRTSLAF